ncbi:MAG: ABC transporter permease [Proteobacteria bacterium]|nr:ABC transporter permease [Pseudomonadota bacterium]
MLNFVVVRLAQMIPILIGISLTIFILVRAVPGDPAAMSLGVYASAERVAELRAHWGLDRSLIVQYGIFLKQLLRGDFGYSYFYGRPAIELVLDRLFPELFLVAYAIVLTIVISVSLAIWAAVRRSGLADAVVRAVIVLGLGLPPYWIGLLLLLLFGIWWPILPVGGFGATLGEQLRSLLLPAFTLALGLCPLVIRSLRSSLLETLTADHVDMARSKGLSERVVFFRHVFRPALIPAVTILGLHIGLLIGATLVVESVFSVPGLGQLMLTAITTRDYPTVVAVTLVFAVFVMVINLLTDLLVAFIDPRARDAMVGAR